MSVLTFESVTKSYDNKHPVLKDVSLSIDKGETVVIIGPSGSGKTTVLRVLAGLEPFQSGEVVLNGTQILPHVGQRGVEKHMRAVRTYINGQIGLVFQHFNLFPHLTALENVSLAPLLHRKMTRAQARTRGLELLERMGLAEKSEALPAALSGGQQQRVAIARALAMGPAVMLFDEATSALDPEVVGEVLKVMADLATEGTTMLCVTHEMQFARAVANRVIVMDEGQVIEEGSPDAVFTSPSSSRTRAFLSRVVHPQIAPSSGPGAP